MPRFAAANTAVVRVFSHATRVTSSRGEHTLSLPKASFSSPKAAKPEYDLLQMPGEWSVQWITVDEMSFGVSQSSASSCSSSALSAGPASASPLAFRFDSRSALR